MLRLLSVRYFIEKLNVKKTSNERNFMFIFNGENEIRKWNQ